jgi:hypothetical protein
MMASSFNIAGVRWIFFLILGVACMRAEAVVPTVSSRIHPRFSSSQEAFVWRKLANGEIADLGDFGCNKRNPDKCIVTVDFLESILFDERYRSALTSHGIRLVHARFAKPIDLSNTSISPQMMLTDCDFNKPVKLAWTEATKFLSFRGSRFHTDPKSGKKATLDLRRIRLAKSLDLSGGSFQDVKLDAATIQELLDLRGARFTGTLSMRRINVGLSLLMREKGEFKNVVLHQAKIGGDLDLSDSVFWSNLDLTSARIGGDLRLGWRFYAPALWANGAELILRNAEANAIEDGTEDLKYWPKVDLIGFTYAHLGGLTDRTEDSMLGRNAEWFTHWLRKQPHYSPQPYRQLMQVLRNAGYETKSKEIGYASKQRQREEAWKSGELLGWFNLSLQWAFIGYGYVYLRTFAWIIVLTSVGAYVLGKQQNAPQRPMIERLFYSLDMLIPLIELDDRHTKAGLEGYVRYYFYLHTIVGFILASYLVAGLSGVTK